MSQLSLRNVTASRQMDFVYENSPAANRRVLSKCADNPNEAELKTKLAGRAEEDDHM